MYHFLLLKYNTLWLIFLKISSEVDLLISLGNDFDIFGEEAENDTSNTAIHDMGTEEVLVNPLCTRVSDYLMLCAYRSIKKLFLYVIFQRFFSHFYSTSMVYVLPYM